MQPRVYHCYRRDNWSPGQHNNVPAQTLYFTNRDKLRLYISKGGHLEALQEREVENMKDEDDE